MAFHFHVPGPPLSDFVDMVWLHEGRDLSHAKERVLPTGTVELVINLTDDVIRSYDHHDPDRFVTLPGSIVAGTRSEFMVIDTDSHATIMGVHFKPGGAFPFLGMPAGEVHDMDVALDDLWRSEAGDLRGRLIEAPTMALKFRTLELALMAHMSRSLGRHPAVAFALNELSIVPQARTLADVTREIGLSQRRFIEVFREQVGMTPKLYHRIVRFQEALQRIESGTEVNWADLALACGYYDQPHFIRDFKAFSGINPSTYLARRNGSTYHIPLDD